jgi:hypothetical protein
MRRFKDHPAVFGLLVIPAKKIGHGPNEPGVIVDRL